MNEQDSLSIRDVRWALSYIAGGPAALHLIEVTLVDGQTGDVQHPNLKAALDESGLDLGIYWFAIQEEKGADTVLLLPLYSQKFQKLIRKWNRTDRGSHL